MDLGIAGRHAAVAGASSGLGLATARALAAAGVHVAICGRDAERIERAAAAIEGSVTAVVADVSTVDGAAAFIDDAVAALGSALDILVTNAGGPPPGTFADINFCQLGPPLNSSPSHHTVPASKASRSVADIDDNSLR